MTDKWLALIMVSLFLSIVLLVTSLLYWNRIMWVDYYEYRCTRTVGTGNIVCEGKLPVR